MAQAQSNLGQQIVHAARLAATMHIRAVLDEAAAAGRNQVMDDRFIGVSSVIPSRANTLRMMPPPERGAA